MIIIKSQDNKKSQLYFYCDNIFLNSHIFEKLSYANTG
ncbi:hypothetical protein EGH31_1304 [Haemophilus haemolyticus]|uniref:Uncharacterized protein n=1 Tax=Haemophilus haemolyticus TaxID=726 RepID=A0AAQ1YKF6_HAEHA|nr:hypothetical protein EGH31_1304 [Haemophilus haemolyticus]